MSVVWYKVWSDLWDNKVRTVLAVLSIAVGVFAVGVTFGMSDQLLAGMDAAHQASIPAHFTIAVTQNVDETIVNRLKKIEGVDDIALGNFVAIRYKIKPEDEWDTAWLINREDFEFRRPGFGITSEEFDYFESCPRNKFHSTSNTSE